MSSNQSSNRIGRVLIVGGGIGGLSAAVALRRVGIAAEVFERAPQLRAVGAALTLWTNAVKALRRIGLEDQVAKLGCINEMGNIRTAGGRILAENNSGEMGRRLGAPSITAARSDLQRILLDALPAGSVHAGCECVSVEQDAGGATVKFADGRTEIGDLVVGADGIKSAVRKSLFGEIPLRYAGYTAWRGLAKAQKGWFPPGLVTETWGRGHRFGMLHCGQGWVYFYATRNCAAGVADPPQGRKHDLVETFAGWHHPIPEILAATEEADILRNDVFDVEPVTEWGRGRVTLLGDAIHPTTPNLGQGGCQAVEDAVFLADRLRRAADGPSGLRDYEASRRDRTRMITETSWKIGKMAQWSNPIACAFRNWLTARKLVQRRISAQIESIISVELPELPAVSA